MRGERVEEILRELREDPLTALWLAGNALAFLCLLWLLLTV